MMKYSRVYMDSMGYELPPIVLTSADLEERLMPLYKKLHIPEGQLAALTGIEERRWWEEGYLLSDGAIAAARKTLASSNVEAQDIEMLIYGGVCRENFEPATGCRVADVLGINLNSAIYDVSNACLGVLNGIINIANHIELGHIKAGLVVSSESAREIIETTINRMLYNKTMEYFIGSLATLTGGSGSVAVLLTDGSFNSNSRRKLLGGVACSAPEFHRLCRWGLDYKDSDVYEQTMHTDAVAIMKNGVKLGLKTWKKFLEVLGWKTEKVDKTICHQVGSTHRNTILEALGIPGEKDFFTFPYLGNIGTVSLPITAAIADEREFLQPGDNVGFLGIGSGLNCLMLGWKW